ncbi:MAG: hypothetical protein DDT25_00260 [Chloroflexi bacterium]|nr:hypothetical protein [Chloroflexota bacterium]
MWREMNLRKHGGKQKGQTLIEVVVALALIALIIPATFTALSAAITSADRVRDRSVMLELIQAQMESIQGQEFRPGGDYDVISLPVGFAIEVEVVPVPLFYPDGTPAEVIIQRITITLTGRHRSLEMEGYKVRR